MFSTSCHYALQAIIFIALKSEGNKNVDLTSISSELDIPKHFLSKILQMLVKHRLLASMKGPTGGFSLNIPADKITLIKVVEIVDGLDVFNRCGIGFKECDDQNPCPIHFEFCQVREQIQDVFESKTLEQLKQDILDGKSIISPDLTEKLAR